MDGFKVQKAELERRLAVIQPAPASQEVVPDDLLIQLRERLESGLDDVTKQEIASVLVKRITVYTTVVDEKKSTRIVIEYNFVVSTSTGTREGQNYTNARRVVTI